MLKKDYGKKNKLSAINVMKGTSTKKERKQYNYEGNRNKKTVSKGIGTKTVSKNIMK